MNVRVSVIVPVYNVAPYLSECLESVRAQGVEDMEILAINDASTDNSGEILETYAQKDARIKATHLAKNIGLGFARNEGLKQARGAWVAFLDSDDVMAAGGLSELLATGERYQSDLVVGNVAMRTDEADGTFSLGPWLNINPGVHINTSLARTPQLISLFACWHSLYRRDFIEHTGARFLRGFHEDSDFVLETLLAANAISTRGDVVFMHYRKRYSSQNGQKALSAQNWTPERLSMLLESVERSTALLDVAREAGKFTNIETLQRLDASRHFGFFIIFVLPELLSRKTEEDFTKELERTTQIFAKTRLWARGIETSLKDFRHRRFLVFCGYYRLALWLLLQRRWRGLSWLLGARLRFAHLLQRVRR